MTISEKRDEIKKELGEIKREIYDALDEDTIWKLVNDFMAKTRAVKTKWITVRNICDDPFHNLSGEERGNKACPKCGIEEFEWIMENDF